MSRQHRNYLTFFLIAVIMGPTCLGQPSSLKSRQEAVIDKYLKQGAWRYDMFSQDWQQKIDEGLKEDSTIAYLWQQKAMPLFKQGKYELGMKYLDKAVTNDPGKWQDYRGFMYCIFVKNYTAAIEDLEKCISRVPYGYIMDHSYDFYIALSHLQLNEFSVAEKILAKQIEKDRKERGEDWVHHLDLFYFGIALYEQKKYNEAIAAFDSALKLYPRFSDVKYYKAKALQFSGDKESAGKIMLEAKVDAEKGYSINEDNAIYERYPYQVNWKLVH